MRRLLLARPQNGTCLFDRDSGDPILPQTLKPTKDAENHLKSFCSLYDPSDPTVALLSVEERTLTQETCQRGLAPVYWRALRRELGPELHLSWQSSADGLLYEPEGQRIRTRSGRLISLGFWAKGPGDSRYVLPAALVDPAWECDRREKIVRYLRDAPQQAGYMGWSYCRFKCGVPDSRMGDSDLSDGTYYWPQGLFHYVEQHNVRLPSDFIDHMETQNFKPPQDLAIGQFSSEDAQRDFWISWCAKNARS